MDEETRKAKARSYIREEMNSEKLKSTHILYDANISEWKFLQAAYCGSKELVRLGYLGRHERESITAYTRRVNEAFGFSYTSSIVDIFNFYLFKKEASNDFEALENNKLWEMFNKDCDLYGNAFSDFITNQSIWSSVFGYIGLLLDKASVELKTKQEEIDLRIYPYISKYFPSAILDWEYKRDPITNRPFLNYIKLKDNGSQFRLWFLDHWEIWDVRIDEKTKQEVVTFVDAGLNELKEIPFIWLYNKESHERPIGVSDIHDIARIDLSILRNLSQGEEIINLGAFPMMRIPKKESSIDGSKPTVHEDEVGPKAVLEFDVDNPDSKADWLDSKVESPLNAIKQWILQKVNEIYRSSNSGGVAATETSGEAKSGVALKTEFLLLNSVLVKKAVNLEKAERKIVRLWLDYERIPEKMDKIKLERERSYDVENLSEDLENILTSKVIVISKKFDEYMQKNVVRKMLPTLTEKQYAEIDDEILENIEKKPDQPEDDDEKFFNDEDKTQNSKGNSDGK